MVADWVDCLVEWMGILKAELWGELKVDEKAEMMAATVVGMTAVSMAELKVASWVDKMAAWMAA